MAFLHAHSEGEGVIRVLEEVFLHGLIDTLKLVPFLFLTYLLMEFIEHRSAEKTQRLVRRAGALGPVIGGALGAVVDMISYLVPEGTPVASFDQYMDAIQSTDSHVVSVPCVGLCDEYTASAGELFIAALKDYASESFGLLDATIIGTGTYKKGVMQSTFTLYDGSSITLTVARYNPPSGVNYDGVGVVPDIFLENLTEDEDTQLLRAYEVLLGKLGTQS